MHIEEYLYSRLSGFGGLSALVSTRVSPMKAIEFSDLPAATFKRVAGGLDYDHDGAEALTESFWQIDAWGSSYTAARDVAAQIVAAIEADDPRTFYAFVLDVAQDYETDTRIYRAKVEVRILYREA